MGLGSVMQTALSGMSAATTSLQVTANNLANQQTPGFKASRVHLATQPPTTFAGAAGSAQVGTGVQVAEITPDFSQGPIELDDNQPALLALQGEGMFILETDGGERLYTRDGRFQLNADGELVNSRGQRVLGFRADADGNLDTSRPASLKIAVGAQSAGSGGGTAALQRFSVSRDGRLLGHFSDGTRRTLGQLRLARFPNPHGLAQRAGNTFRATPASGLPQEFAPGEAGAAEVIGGATELSNTDLGRELVDLMLAGNQYRANVLVLETADTLLGELIFTWRRR
jgi:flagellar hook protein FlgE